MCLWSAVSSANGNPLDRGALVRRSRRAWAAAGRRGRIPRARTGADRSRRGVRIPRAAEGSFKADRRYEEVLLAHPFTFSAQRADPKGGSDERPIAAKGSRRERERRSTRAIPPTCTSNAATVSR